MRPLDTITVLYDYDTRSCLELGPAAVGGVVEVLTGWELEPCGHTVSAQLYALEVTATPPSARFVYLHNTPAPLERRQPAAAAGEEPTDV